MLKTTFCPHCVCDEGSPFGWVNTDGVKHCALVTCCADCLPDRNNFRGGSVMPIKTCTLDSILWSMQTIGGWLGSRDSAASSAYLIRFKEKLLLALTIEYDRRMIAELDTGSEES